MNGKSPRKRKPPTQLILSEEFKQHMEARMKSKEGMRALNEWAGIIADWIFEQMPRDLLQGLASREGKKILEEIWRGIVNAYFRALSNPRLCNDPTRPRNYTTRYLNLSASAFVFSDFLIGRDPIAFTRKKEGSSLG
jgi:hypothetical protein